MNDEVWLRIITIHQYAKDLLIKCEEIDPQISGFIQPFKEQRDALEHIMRAQSAFYHINDDISNDTKEKYISGNLEKALGHSYRAFFDIADWIGIRIRDKVHEQMSPYTPECITKMFPSYYRDIKPKIEKTNIEIAQLRGEKDIPKTDRIITTVEKYYNVIEELIGILQKIPPYIPQLEGFKRKERKTSIYNRIWQVGLVILGIILTLLFQYLMAKFPINPHGSSSP